MSYGWIITEDVIFNGEQINTMSANCPANIKETLKLVQDGKDQIPEDGDHFRMYDDDGEHYYSGIIVGDYQGFEPLDDFGMPNAGATEVKLLHKGTGVWETL